MKNQTRKEVVEAEVGIVKIKVKIRIDEVGAETEVEGAQVEIVGIKEKGVEAEVEIVIEIGGGVEAVIAPIDEVGVVTVKTEEVEVKSAAEIIETEEEAEVEAEVRIAREMSGKKRGVEARAKTVNIENISGTKVQLEKLNLLLV